MTLIPSGAAFTMRLKDVIAVTGGTADIDPATGIRKLVNGNIGLQYYPIFDDAYRDSLTGKIIDHYYNQEIGMESIGMFQLAVRRRMNEIMPYYNQLYKSTLIEFDPLSSVDLHTVSASDATQNAVNSGTNETTNNTDSKSRSVTSETPQTMLAGNSDYASGAADVHGVTDATTNATENSNQDTTATTSGDSSTKGYQGPASELLMNYRRALVNIDMDVISALEDCFMLVWDTGDSYTQSNGNFAYGY